MIKKLRKKFVLTNMLLVFAVLLIVFGTLCYTGYTSAVRQTENSMRMFTENTPDPIHKFDVGEKKQPYLKQDAPFRSDIPVFCVKIKNGTEKRIISTDNTEVSSELAEKAVDYVLENGSDRGTISSLGLRYYVKKVGEEKDFVFADMSFEHSQLLNSVLTSLGVMLGGLAAFFFISLFLSKLVVRPVEEAWQRQRQFVADASHELKTPLTVILANSDILLSHTGDTVESQSKWVNNTRDEALHMKKLVDDMLCLAKSDASKPEMSNICLSDAVMNSILPFEAVAYEAGIELESDVADDIEAYANAHDISALTAVFLDNAFKYSASGEKVAVRLFKERDRAVLSVSNTGSYIPSDEQAHIFERFYRSDFSRSASGYGLGLSIASNIAQNHRARLSVSSTQKEGTTFKVIFPPKQR